MFASEERYGPRLSVYLCHCSSEDADHPGSSLRYQTRGSIGWQSSKQCIYPQELGFRFEGEVELHYMRLLIHESKIPSRIEVFIAELSEDEIQTGILRSYENALFHRLGYAGFSTNEENEFSARELKTVNIRRRCVYVKLLILRPYRSDYNVYQQVGIVALTGHGAVMRTFPRMDEGGNCFVGERVDVPMEEMVPPRPEDWSKAQQSQESGKDIDSATLQRITEMQLMKERAVAAEDYDLAAALKSCINSLEEIGQQIFGLEVRKSVAVKEEDYAAAKELKREIDKLREETYRIPTMATPPPTDKVGSVQHHPEINNEASDTQDSLPLSPPLKQTRQPARKPSSLSSSQQQQRQRSQERNGNKQRVERSQVGNPSHPVFDEMPVVGRGYYPLDALEKALSEQQQSRGVPPDLINGRPEWEQKINHVLFRFCGDQQQASPLQGSVLSEARHAEKVFGSYCVSCLFGKRGPLREAAVRAIASKEGYRALSSHSSNVIETLLVYLGTPLRGLNDAVPGVVIASCEAMQSIVNGELSQAPSVSALMSPIQTLLPELVSRSGDNNARIREMAESVLHLLLEFSSLVDSLTSVLLVDPDASGKRPALYRVHVSRLRLLTVLVDRYGVSGDEAPNLETGTILAKAVMPCLHHSNGEVRESASQLFAKLLFLSPQQTASYLNELKPAQQNVIERYVEELKESLPHRPRTVTEGKGSERRAVLMESTASSGLGGDSSWVNSNANSVKGSRRAAGAQRDVFSPVSSSGSAMLEAGQQHKNDERLAKTCQFCGEYNEGFSDAALDIHYLRGCPMLCPCPLCDQVTEIATLQQHLTSECENSHLVQECPICKEAVRVEDIKKHVAAKVCIKAVPTHSVCPLCHTRFAVGSTGWLKHLAAPPGCPNNPRKHDGSGPFEL